MKKLFTAAKARELTDSAKRPEVDYEAKCVLESIKYEAGQGRYEYDVYYILQDQTIQTLLDLGYTVRQHGPAQIERDSLYYTIKWGI